MDVLASTEFLSAIGGVIVGRFGPGYWVRVKVAVAEALVKFFK